jgi:hypothetical protein
MPKGFRDMKKELENRQKQSNNINKWNLSPETLEAYAENKRKVEAGLLPKYIGGSVDAPNNPEVENRALRVVKFCKLIKDK